MEGDPNEIEGNQDQFRNNQSKHMVDTIETRFRLPENHANMNNSFLGEQKGAKCQLRG